MAEWSNALVLKTSEGHTSGGSNPSFSASKFPNILLIYMLGFFILIFVRLLYGQMLKVKIFQHKSLKLNPPTLKINPLFF